MGKLLEALVLILCLQPDWVHSQKNGDQQQVKQNSPSLSVQEGGTSILNCDYNNNMFDYFAWYKKYPAKGPAFLISIRSVMDKKEDGRFKIFLNEDAELFDTLSISQKCCAVDHNNKHRHVVEFVSCNDLVLGVRSQEVQQSPQSLIIQEEEEFNITCKFSKTLYALHWYWQKHGEGPTFLMMLRRGGEEMSRDKITATLDEKKQHSSLYITASQHRHSGTYFCAGETQ